MAAGMHVEDEFDGAPIGTRTIGHQYTQGTPGPPYAAGIVPNTVFDGISQGQGTAGGVFVAGRNGTGAVAAKIPPTSWNQVVFEKYLNGYDPKKNVGYGPDPMTGDLVAKGWFKIEGGLRGFSLMRVNTIDIASRVDEDWGVDGIYSDYDSDNFALNLFYVNNQFGGQPGTCQLLYRPADWLGPNGWNNVWVQAWCDIPLDEWLYCELRYSAAGVIQCIVKTEADVVLMDTGAVQSVTGWTPYTVMVSSPYDPPTTNAGVSYPASLIRWDYFEAMISETPVIQGRPDNVRRRFVRAGRA